MEEIMGKVMLVAAEAAQKSESGDLTDEEGVQLLDKLVYLTKSFLDEAVAERNRLFGEQFGNLIVVTAIG